MSEHDHLPDAAIAPESELEGAYEHEHEGHGAEHGHEHEHALKKAPRLPFVHRSKAGVAKWKRETRFGVAALLSFVILVSVLLVNKGSKGPKPPSMAIASTEGSSSDSSKAKPKSVPDADKEKDRTRNKQQDEKPDQKKEDVTPPDPMETNPPLPSPDAVSPALADAKVQDAGTELDHGSTSPPGENTSLPLPSLATETALGHHDLSDAKGPEPALPQPATTTGPTGTDEQAKNLPTPPDPAPAPTPTPAPAAGSNLLSASEPEAGKSELPGATDLPVPVDPLAAAPDASAPAQAAASPATAPDATAPTGAAAPLTAASDANAPATAAPDASAPATAAPDASAPATAASDASAPAIPAATATPDVSVPAQAAVPPPQSPELGSGLSLPGTAPTSGAGQTAATAAPAPVDTAASAVRPAEEVPNFASPPSSDDAMALSSAPPEFKPGEGIPIPNAGKGRSLEDDLPVKLAPAAAAAGASMAAAGAVAAKAEETEVDPLTPELHVVQSGENFWTISKYYYNSGRFYVALWKANSRTVSAPDQLAVGQTIVIPPPEALDRTLIAPPRKTSSSASRGSSQIRKTSRSKSNENDSSDTAARSSSEVELILPIDNSMISRRSRLQSADEPDPPPGKRYQVSRPRYKVRAHETLRSIARDTLNDARRADEIYDLNRDILNDDPRNLVEGQILELPEEARVGRSSR